jgi:hypothetical protein
MTAVLNRVNTARIGGADVYCNTRGLRLCADGLEQAFDYSQEPLPNRIRLSLWVKPGLNRIQVDFRRGFWMGVHTLAGGVNRLVPTSTEYMMKHLQFAKIIGKADEQATLWLSVEEVG